MRLPQAVSHGAVPCFHDCYARGSDSEFRVYNGKENGNYHLGLRVQGLGFRNFVLGLCGDDGKENGIYRDYIGFYRDYRVYIGGYIEIMEKKMETTIMGYMRVK